MVVALDQWLLADRPRDVLRLLSANHGHLYDSGREATVKRTIAAIPTAVAVSDLESMVDYAWCHLLVDRRRFVELVEQLTWWADTVEPEHDTVRARVDVLRASAAVVSGRWVESGALSRQVMLDLGESCWQDPLGRFAANGIAREAGVVGALGRRLRRGAPGRGRPEPRSGASRWRSRGPERWVRRWPAGRWTPCGWPPAFVAPPPVADMTILRAELALAEALAHRELGDRSRAVAELAALADAPAETMLFCRVLAMCELAQAHLDGGDLDAAWHVFGQAEALVEAESLGADVRGWLARVGTVLALAEGDLEAARRWADQVDDPFWRGVSTARVHLATGDRPAAHGGRWTTAVPRCVRHEVVAGPPRGHVQPPIATRR